MTIEYIRYRIPDATSEQFEQAYQRAAVALAAAPECEDYELSRCEEAPEYYTLRITWTSTRDHLEKFRSGEHFQAFFREIGPYVNAIEEMRHYRPTEVQGRGAAIPTLYEWAGGAEALDKLFNAFYVKVRKDPELAPLFRDMDPDHPHHVALWLGEVFGGPPAYSTGHGGHAHMVGRHLGKGITEQQRRRWMQLLLDTADDVALPSDPEFRAAFVGYIEWGTRLAVFFSRPGASPDVHEPMPTWNWPRPPWRPSASPAG